MLPSSWHVATDQHIDFYENEREKEREREREGGERNHELGRLGPVVKSCLRHSSLGVGVS